MTTIQDRIENAVSRLETDAALNRRYIHGAKGYTTEDGVYVPSIIEQSTTQIKGYETKALLTAVSGIFVGQLASVTNDATAANNGSYRWSGSAWVKSQEQDGLVKETDFVIKKSKNMANAGTLTTGSYVNNSGTITVAAGWKYIKIPVEAGKQYTFGNFAITTGGYYSVWNLAGSSLQVTTFGTATLPITVTIPTGGVWLLIDIARPTDTADRHAKVMVNEGATLLAYEAAVDTIVGIDRFALAGESSSGGGEIPSNVAVLGSDANFADLMVDSITAAAIIANLPMGAGAAPSGVETGQAWIDTSAGNAVKVKL